MLFPFSPSLRRSWRSLLSVGLLLVIPLAHAAVPPPAATAPKILVLGDSLSAGYGIDVRRGWVALLQQQLRQAGYGHVVVNASVSGETTAGALARLPRALQLHRPVVVIIELGGNDGLRALPPADLQRNLAAIARASRAAGAKPLLLGMQLPPNYGPEYTRRFAAAYPAVAKAERTALVPFFLDGIATQPALFQADGIHPVEAAQPRLMQNLWPALKKLL
jgi:acyl-CoA thioesterase-1